MSDGSIVTVIVPCFNYGHLISETLDSVIAQTYPNWECIIIDDGSTDNSKEVVAGYVNKDKRFKYVYQSNRGLPAARNRGIREAKGDYFQFLDADDLIESRKLELQAEYLKEHPEVDIVYGDCRYFSTDNPDERLFSMWEGNKPWMPKISGKGKDILRHLIEMNIMVVSSPLIRKKFINVCGLFDETLKANEDWELWIRCTLHDFYFAYLELPETYALIRTHASSMSQNLSLMYSACLEMHKKIHYTLTDKEIVELNMLEIARFTTELHEINLTSAIERMKKNQRVSGFCQLLKYSILDKCPKYLSYGVMLLLLGEKSTTKISRFMSDRFTLWNLIFDKPHHEAAVVIPIYKTILNDYETISLDRCLKVLGTHPIIVIAPEGLSLEHIDLLKLCDVKVIHFPAHCFASIVDYNKLMLNIDFYKTFIDYRYILIYQLDAFVFSDQLLDWCRLSYDYIGAPWIGKDWVQEINNLSFLNPIKFLSFRHRSVGNGGFSLRKIKTSILALVLLKFVVKRWKRWSSNEDVFWSFPVPSYLPFFKIPEPDLAMQFAFESQPAWCFEQNSRQLPFGCHAWEKEDIVFWRPIFERLGYQI